MFKKINNDGSNGEKNKNGETIVLFSLQIGDDIFLPIRKDRSMASSLCALYTLYGP